MGEARSPCRQGRHEIRTALEERRNEIEAEILNRLKSIVDTDAISDPEYIDGLQRSVPAGLNFALSAITASVWHLPPVPVVLIAQAQLAARNRLAPDDIMRRYGACRTVFEGALAEEAELKGLAESVMLSDLLRSLGLLFDELIDAVSEGYRLERKRLASHTSRRLTLVRGILLGEERPTADLDYDFNAFHIGLVAKGRGSRTSIETLAQSLDSTSLIVRNDDGATWAWLCRRRKPDAAKFRRLALCRWPDSAHCAIGEPASGVAGWRQTHRQAAAAFLLALYKPGRLVQFSMDPLLLAALRDDILSNSLKELYLAPLTAERDGGLSLRGTLRTYFANGRNGASTAIALSVSRQTINNRLATVENRIGRSLGSCAKELEVALKLEELRNSATL